MNTTVIFMWPIMGRKWVVLDALIWPWELSWLRWIIDTSQWFYRKESFARKSFPFNEVYPSKQNSCWSRMSVYWRVWWPQVRNRIAFAIGFDSIYSLEFANICVPILRHDSTVFRWLSTFSCASCTLISKHWRRVRRNMKWLKKIDVRITYFVLKTY